MRPLLLLATTALLLPTAVLAQSHPNLVQLTPPAPGALSAQQLMDMESGKADLLGIATGSTAMRDIRDRYADIINVKDFGAVGDGVTDDTAAINAALKAAANPLRVAGGSVYAPAATYHVAGQVAATFAGTQLIRLIGDGLGSELLFDGDGPHLSMTATAGTIDQGGFDIRGLLFRHNSSTAQSNVGLTVTGIGGTVTFDSENLRLDGLSGAGSWNVGARLINVGAAIDHLEVHIPDANSASYTSPTYGLDIEGTVVSAGNYIYSIDNKISNSVFEGGLAGVHLGGPWQGLYVTNSVILGNNYGVMGDNAALPGQQNMLIANDHINAHLAGVYTRGVNQIAVANVLFLHLGGPSDPFAMVDAGNGQELSLTGSTMNGYGSGDEEGVRLVGIHEANVTGNNVITLHGPFTNIDSTSSNVAVVGNMAANFSGYSGAHTVGCGGSVSCGMNNFDGTSDYSFDGTNITLSAPGATFSLGQIFVGNPNGGQSYGFRTTTGGLVNALTMDTSGIQYLGGGAAKVQIGSSSVPVNIPGAAALGQATANTLIFDPSGAIPTTSSSACTPGQEAWGSGYIYICIATNTWQRAALSAF